MYIGRFIFVIGLDVIGINLHENLIIPRKRISSDLSDGSSNCTMAFILFRSIEFPWAAILWPRNFTDSTQKRHFTCFELSLKRHKIFYSAVQWLEGACFKI